MANNRVTIVTVCHNSLAVLPAMLKSVPKGTPVILVDNASFDTGKLQKLAQDHDATLHLNADNIGFGHA